MDADNVAAKINADIQQNKATAWKTGQDATCYVTDAKVSVSIGEEEMLDMWQGITEENRIGHLSKVPNSDGAMIQPTHEETLSEKSMGIGFVSPTKS